MPDWTAEVDINTRDANESSWEVISGKVVYKGTGVALCGPTHGTAANKGRIQQFTGAAGELFVGLSPARRTGAVTGEDPVLGGAWMADKAYDLPVTGLTGDRTDVLLPVYSTAGNVYTTVRPAAPNSEPIGVVLNFISSTRAWVFIIGLGARLASQMAGGNVIWNMLTFPAHRASSGNLATSIPAPYHGRFLEVFAICTGDPSDTDFAATVNLEINGVDLTGGVVTIGFADACGDKKAGTTITGANEFRMGDLIDIEIAIGTAGTVNDGQYNLMARVERLPGL